MELTSLMIFSNRANLLNSAGSFYRKVELCALSLILFFFCDILTFSLILAIFILVYLAKYLLAERKGIVSVIMHKDSTAADILKSYIHALVMANLRDEKISLHLESQSWMDKQYEIFIQKVCHEICLQLQIV